MCIAFAVFSASNVLSMLCERSGLQLSHIVQKDAKLRRHSVAVENCSVKLANKQLLDVFIKIRGPACCAV